MVFALAILSGCQAPCVVLCVRVETQVEVKHGEQAATGDGQATRHR